MLCMRRLQKDYIEILTHNSDGTYACPKTEENMSEWLGIIAGPCLNNTPYEGGKFMLDIKIPSDYPFKPPKIKFITPIHHCNINLNGDISLDILGYNWSPSLTIKKLMMGVCTLIRYPCPDTPLVAENGLMYIKNKTEYDRLATLYTDLYAKWFDD
jgi:ubiquitin-protein ligase